MQLKKYIMDLFGSHVKSIICPFRLLKALRKECGLYDLLKGGFI